MLCISEKFDFDILVLVFEGEFSRLDVNDSILD